MTEFKEWLLNEDGFADAGGNSWDVLYPTYADDYPHVSAAPLDHFFLQRRWNRGEDLGRVLHNIDNDEFQKRGYVGISSPTMPDTGDCFWKHKPDKTNEGSTKPYKQQDLRWIIIGKTSKDTKDTDNPKSKKIWSKFGSTKYEPDTNLNQIFHDEDMHTHKWPTIDPNYIDANWVLPKHKPKLEESMNFKNWLEDVMHGGIVGLPHNVTNSTMPVRSKYTTSDSKVGNELSHPRKDKNGNPSTVDSEWLGKKRIPLSKHPKERKSMWIDRDKRSIPTRDDRPDTIY